MDSKVIPLKKYQSNLKSIRKLSQPTQESNIKPRNEPYDIVLEQIERNKDPQLSAALYIDLGNLLAQHPSEKRAENLEQAIGHFQQALEILSTHGDRNVWALAMHNLANAYSNRIRGDRADNIELSIDYYQQVFNVRTRQDMPNDWAITMGGLANAYCKRIRGDRAENLETAIDHYKQAIDVMMRNSMPADWAGMMMNLAIAYADRIRGNRAENIELAIEYYKKVLSIRTRKGMPIGWADATVNLANAYTYRIKGDPAENLERAIGYYKQILEIIKKESMPIFWAIVMNNLGFAYHSRIKGNRAENLERSIRYYKLTLTVQTRQSMPIDWAQTTWNLANVFSDRIRGNRAENLERAIDYHKQALIVRTRQSLPSDWAQSMMDLATAYMNRTMGDQAENIEQAIKYLKQSLNVRTKQAMPIAWAQTIGNLAIAYSERIRGDQANNIEVAIECYQQALKIMTRKNLPSDWAQAMGNLASAYAQRIQGDRAENLERAIECYEQALTIQTRSSTPVTWAYTMKNLAKTYSKRIFGKRTYNLERAIEQYQQALEIIILHCQPDVIHRAERALGDLFFDQESWLEAADAYRRALTSIDLLYKEAATPEARQLELRKIRDLPARIAYALSKKFGLESSGALKNAVMTLEQNRARWLSEELSLNSEKPKSVPHNVWQTFVEKREEVRALIREIRVAEANYNKHNFKTISEKLNAARKALSNAIAKIQKLDDSFMPEPKFDEVLNAISKISKLKGMKGLWAITYFAITPVGTLAIVLPSQSSEIGIDTVKLYPVWCDMTESNLDELILRKEDKKFIGYLPAQHGEDSMEAILDYLLPIAGRLLMKPLAVTLRHLGVTGTVLIPGALLGALPLGAALIKDFASAEYHCFLEEFEVIYAPSALALSRGYLKLAKLDYYKRQNTLVAVGDPSNYDHSRLPSTTIEIEGISAYFPEKRLHLLQKEKATRKAIIDIAPGATMLHFACHGKFVLSKPLDSALYLSGNEPLKLSDILNELSLKNCRLVILSACQTAIVDITKLPDEVIGLPAGFISAGVPGVIGTLWLVKDVSTALLMDRFYYFYCSKRYYPAAALRAAQLWLRDLSNEELIAFLQKRIDASEGQTRMVYSLILKKFDRHASNDPEEKPFASPVFWAAFTFTGI